MNKSYLVNQVNIGDTQSIVRAQNREDSFDESNILNDLSFCRERAITLYK